MPNIGPLEIAIVLVIALVVVGPKRLPELGTLVPGEEHRVRLPEPASADDTLERLSELLDRAHMRNAIKNAIYDAVLAAPTPADAALELVGMDLRPALLAAVTELLLAR